MLRLGILPTTWILSIALGLSTIGGLSTALAQTTPPPNLVLITLDTTRADHLGAWGWPHARTPHLDALAARGTRFARCDSAAPITLPSHSTILTGLYPPRHGARDNGTFVLGEQFETLTERLKASGYKTAAVISAVVLARRYGTAQGFDIYDDDLGPSDESGILARERGADKTTARALELVGGLKSPFFLWVHYFDPHDPYEPPPGYAARVSGPQQDYDGEISFMDEHIGKLLAGLPEGSTVAVVGDHGEMLGDHGEPTHGLLLNQGARRVPLILAGPGVPVERTVNCLVRTVDVTPTLLELAGLPIVGDMDGESLVPLFTEDRCTRTSYAESYLPLFAHQWYPLRAFSDDDWLYVHGPRPGLFHLQGDVREEKDLAVGKNFSDGKALAEMHARQIERLRSQLEALVRRLGEELEATVGQGRTLSAEEEAQLRSLGYVGGSSATSEVRSDLPDPREMVDVAQAIHQGSQLVAAGRCDEALPLLLEAIRKDDRSFPAYNMSGLCLQAQGRWESALNAFRRATTLNSRAVEPLVNTGTCLLQLGRFQEAVAIYRQAMELDPTAPGVASNLAALLRQGGDLTAASAVLDMALQAGARYGALHVERGVMAGQGGNLESALGEFDQALMLDPTNVDALGNGARAALMLGRPEEAVQRFEKLTALVPDDVGLWMTLGKVYFEQLGDRPNAERCLRRALEHETDPARKAQIEALLQSGGQ